MPPADLTRPFVELEHLGTLLVITGKAVCLPTP
jgi:hypothetical protein